MGTIMKDYGPKTPICDIKHQEKYRGPNEGFREAMTRISSKLGDSDDHFKTFRDILLDMRFLPAGRVQTAIGSGKHVTAHNCYVSGTIEDTFCEGSASIMSRAGEAAQTMRMGGGIGYDFSTLRPRGSLIKKLQSQSSGPLPFMEIFDAVCRATCSSGHRRGAQMGVLRVDHPDIEEFIRSKQDITSLTGFNISVAVTDEFMNAVIADNNFDLRYNRQVYRTIRARDLWDTLMRSTYDWAEPGVLFIDRINNQNNLWYCETITATNPCGEQPLPPYGACLLGSINLVRYLDRLSPKSSWQFDYEQLAYDIPHIVRAMDNVLDNTNYPLHAQEVEALSKRRMGIGVTGVANAIEAIGYEYGSKRFISELSTIMSTIRNVAYEASALLAAEKGPFLRYDRDNYLRGEFIQSLPDYVRETIAEHGIRNSHLLSIAPTGTISFTADNVSSGIEPVFAYKTQRAIIEFDGPKTYTVEDYGYKYLGVEGKTADRCSPNDHLRVLIAASKFVDSAVSKTCNMPQDMPWDEFKDVYVKAWKAGCKGCTTYRMGGMRNAVLTAATETPEEPETVGPEEAEVLVLEDASCEFDPMTGRRSCE